MKLKSHGFLISRVFFDGFWVFLGFFSYFLSFPLFYGVTFKDFGDKTKNLVKRFISTGFFGFPVLRVWGFHFSITGV